MIPEFNIYAGPPLAEQIEAARTHQDRLLLFSLGLVFVCVAVIAMVFFEPWGTNPGKPSTHEQWLLGLGFLALCLIWKLIRIFSGMVQLAEAHPETARAFLACANSTAVKSYSRSIIQQGRNLTMKEANMLMDQCKTREEILKLAAHYDEHGVWPEERG